MHTTPKLANTLGSTSAFPVESYLVETEEYAIAKTADGVVGITWNRSEDRPQGFPSSYKHQQWFMLPKPVGEMILSGNNLFGDNP